jgi:hypothetical protein
MKKIWGSGLIFVLALVLGATSIPLAAQLSTDEEANLTYLREEEKLARDVYTKMCDDYGSNVFCNIKLSEQRHMDAVKGLLDKYGIQDPVAGYAEGEFPTMQDLYYSLIEMGSSIEGAICAGVMIEKLDICDITEFLKNTKKSDLIKVYNNLLNGSYSHLESFRNQPLYTSACEDYFTCSKNP